MTGSGLAARLLAGAALIGALTATRDDPLAGRVAGAPVNCIDLSGIAAAEIVDARTILYRRTERRIWRTAPDGACPGLAPDRLLVAEVQGLRLCQGDRFRVRTRQGSTVGATCRFARFTPYDRAR